MDARKIVVIVEDAEAARTALQWALHNLFRFGDLITLLHVFVPSSTTRRPRRRSRRNDNNESSNQTTSRRHLRLKGFQLALSFKDICNRNFFNTNVEMIVTEGDQNEQEYGGRIAAMVRQIGASALVVGLHPSSFLYQLALGRDYDNIASIFNCRVLAVRQSAAPSLMLTRDADQASSFFPTNMDFSQIDLSELQIPDTSSPKISYRICPDPSAIIWRSSKTKRRAATARG